MYEYEDVELCSNDRDDDGDGLVDCVDASCQGTEYCEDSQATCSDGTDNDGKNGADCEDDACRQASVRESWHEEVCGDERDNDCDGDVDCDDCDCPCPEDSPQRCADDCDNDGNNFSDTADRNCFEVLRSEPRACTRHGGAEVHAPFGRVDCQVVSAGGLCLLDWVPLTDTSKDFDMDLPTADGGQLVVSNSRSWCEPGVISTVRISGRSAETVLRASIAELGRGSVVTVALSAPPQPDASGCPVFADRLGFSVSSESTAALVGTASSSFEDVPDGTEYFELRVRADDRLLELHACGDSECVTGELVVTSSQQASEEVGDVALTVRVSAGDAVVADVSASVPPVVPCSDRTSPIVEGAFGQDSNPEIACGSGGLELYSSFYPGNGRSDLIERRVSRDGSSWSVVPLDVQTSGALLDFLPIGDAETCSLDAFVLSRGRSDDYSLWRVGSADGSTWDTIAGPIVLPEWNVDPPLGPDIEFGDIVRSEAGCEIYSSIPDGRDGSRQIHRWFASDCESFEKDPEAVSVPGAAPADEYEVGCPAVVDLEDRRLMFYVAWTAPAGDSPSSTINMATWDDASSSWRRSEWNPVLEGTIRAFDDGHPTCPDAYYDGNGTVHLVYEGRTGLGYATLNVGR
jgi:hypothetical protein